MPVHTLRPNSDVQKQWPYPLSGDHYLEIDESPHDGDTTYVGDKGNTQKNIHGLTDFTIPAGQTISKVEVTIIARQSNGSPDVKVFLIDGSDETESSVITLTASYASYTVELARPGSLNWSDYSSGDNLNSLQVSYQVANGGGKLDYCRVTAVEVNVTTDQSSITDTIRISMLADLEATVDAEIAHALEVESTNSLRFIHALQAEKLTSMRLGMAIPFEPTFFFPDNDGLRSGTWLKTPSTTYFYENVDEQVPDDDDTYDYVTGSDIANTYIEFRKNDDTLLPIGAGILLQIRVKRYQYPTVSFRLYVRKNGESTKYYSQTFYASTDYSDHSFQWDHCPYDISWGNYSGFYFGVEISSGATIGTPRSFRITQIKGKVINPSIDTIRINHSTTLEKVDQKIGLANSIEFEEWTEPDFFDNGYFRRRAISFGTNHSQLGDNEIVDFELFTGYETREPGRWGLWNEAIQHSSRHIAHHNGYIYVTGIGHNTGDTSDRFLRIVINRFNVNTEAWDTPQLVAVTETTFDSHYASCISIDPNGYIEIYYGCHNSPLKYRKSTNPEDITSWGSEQTIGSGDNLTYPRPVIADNGDRYIFARYMVAVGGYDSYLAFYKSVDGGATWSSAQIVVDYSDNHTGSSSVYIGGVVYKNGRVWIVLNFHDDYGVTNISRAVALIYSDDFTNWYELNDANPDGIKVGETNGTGENLIDYNAVTKIALSPNFPNAPYYHTNAEALAIDDYDRPLFLYFNSEYPEPTEPPVYSEITLARWTGTAWETTDITNLSGAIKQIFHRNGGVLFLDDNDIYIYWFAWPEEQSEQFAGEIFRARGVDYGKIWHCQFQSYNTAFGAGMMSALPEKVNGERWIVYNRGNDIYLWRDTNYNYIRPDGADVRIIKHNIDGTYQEVHRVPDRFQARDTKISFAVDTYIGENLEYHPSVRHYVYFSNPFAANPLADPTQIYSLFNSFESYAGDTDLSTTAEFTGTAGAFTVVEYSDKFDFPESHTQKLRSGRKYVYCNIVASPSHIEVDFDSHNQYCSIKLWVDSSGSFYFELRRSSDNKWIRIGGVVAGNKFYFEKSDSSYSAVGTGNEISPPKMVELIFLANDSGISAWAYNGNGIVPIVTDDTFVDHCDKIRFGTSSTLLGAFWDKVIAWPYIVNPPELVLGAPEGSDNYSTSRITHSIDPAYDAQLRIRHGITPEMTEQIRIGQETELEAIENYRLAMQIIAEAVESARLSGLTILEATEKYQIAHGLDPEATEKIRMAMSAVLEKTAQTRVNNQLEGEKIDSLELANKIISEKTEIFQIAHESILESIESVRLSMELILEATGNLKIMHLVDTEKTDETRLAHNIEFGGHGILRQAMQLLLEATADIRLRHGAILETEDIERMSSILGLEKEDVVAIHNLAHSEKIDILKIVNKLTLESSDNVRILNQLITEKDDTLSIHNLTESEKTEVIRLNNKLRLDSLKIIRIFNQMIAEKVEGIRLCHSVPFIATGSGRVSMSIEFYFYELIGVYLTARIDRPELANLNIDHPKLSASLKKPVLEGLAVGRPTLSNLKIGKPQLDNLRIN